MEKASRHFRARREWLIRAAAAVGTLSGAGSAALVGGRAAALPWSTPARSASYRGGIVQPPPASSSPAQPFRNARTNLRYATLQHALRESDSGDTIKVAAGTYTIASTDSIGSLSNLSTSGVDHGVTQDALTIEWETPGRPALFDVSRLGRSANAAGGDISGITMGISCSNLTIRGVWLRGYRKMYHLNCGVRVLSGYGRPNGGSTPALLTVEYCKFYEFTNGILTRPYDNFRIACNYCVFQDNGNGDGLSHGVYVSDNLDAAFLGCSFYTTANSVPQPGLGHLIKSRARTTMVAGCLFDPAYGTATCMDFANGGDVAVVGNIIFRYGAAQFDDDNPAIKFGEEQTPYFNAHSPLYGSSTENYAHDGRTHSIVLAQNTIRILQPEGGTPLDVMKVTAPTADLPDPGRPLTVKQTVRNNIVANGTGTSRRFVAAYHENSAVPYAAVDDRGHYSGGVIPGNPAVNDARYAWAGDYQVPEARTDTNRGGVAA